MNNLNKMILLLNAVILVVNFGVAFASSDSQIAMLQSTSRMGVVRTGNSYGAAGSATTFLRVVHSLDRILPPEMRQKITASELNAIYDAVHTYYAESRAGVASVLVEDDDREGAALHDLQNLGINVRGKVEAELQQTFRDQGVVKQIATEIFKSA